MALIDSNQLFQLAHATSLQQLEQRGVKWPKEPTVSQQRDLARLIAYYQQQHQYNKLAYYQPYEYQRPLYHLHTQAQAVIASNRSGKSYSVGYAVACHLTGIYPPWWTDIKYNSGIKLVAAGASSNQIREAIQETLFGTADKTDELALGSGLIPRDTVIMDTVITGSDRRAVGGASIRHRSGTLSQIVIASYEQDRAVLQGGKADVIWCDEQPKDDEIISEIIRALAQTPTGQPGRFYLSATPLVGWTPMIKRFWNGAPHHGMVRYSWADVPDELLPQATRELLTSSWLPHEIASRTQGIPMAGAGSVFALDMSTVILKEPPQIQPWFKLIAGIDFGRNPDPTVIIWLYHDPRTDEIVAYDEVVCTNQTPVEYAPHILHRGKTIPLAWPADGKRKGYTETTSAIQELTNRYGINTLAEHFTNPDGSRGIDYGLQYIIGRMRLGKFKISPRCVRLLDEISGYHTEITGNGKVNFVGQDHCIDAMRYGALSIERYGSSQFAEGLAQPEISRWIEQYDLNTY
jgi:phage terminase large subunit-like protein